MSRMVAACAAGSPALRQTTVFVFHERELRIE
jgi:hypothetical protein